MTVIFSGMTHRLIRSPKSPLTVFRRFYRQQSYSLAVMNFKKMLSTWISPCHFIRVCFLSYDDWSRFEIESSLVCPDKWGGNFIFRTYYPRENQRSFVIMIYDLPFRASEKYISQIIYHGTPSVLEPVLVDAILLMQWHSNKQSNNYFRQYIHIYIYREILGHCHRHNLVHKSYPKS